MNRFLDAKILRKKAVEKEEGYKEWLECRKLGVCGSDIAKIMRLSKYGSPLTVYKEKKGDIKPEVTLKMSFAQNMAPVLCEFAKQHFKVLANIDITIEKFPYMICHKDNERFIGNISYTAKLKNDYIYKKDDSKTISADETIGVEIKVTNRSFRENEDKMMEEYGMKCQWYMGLTGMKHFILVILSQNEVFYKLIERNEELIEYMQDEARIFLEENIDKDIEPSPMGIEGEKKIIHDGLEINEDKTVKLPSGILARVKALDSSINNLSLERERLKLEISLMLGDAKWGEDGEYKITRYFVTRKPVDTTMLKLEFPEVYEAIIKEKIRFLNMRISKI